MADQSRPIPVNNEEVVEIIQALQPNVDNATNNPVSEAASAFQAQRTVNRTRRRLHDKILLIRKPRETLRKLVKLTRQNELWRRNLSDCWSFLRKHVADCLAVVREQREDLDIRPTQGVKPLGINYRVWLCAHPRCVAVCPLRGVAVCPLKYVCVISQEVWLCAHRRGVAMCPPKRCGYVPTKGCGCVPTQEVWLCLHLEVWLGAHKDVWPRPHKAGVGAHKDVWRCVHRGVAVGP
ncbi:hypothetical protein OS493_039023 [Desmophyllum pertusum]|uniref:Uncharacterized protein n=1 Tax=Desmophyllum pertusum TaxID=174260 RepID=A0A9W9YHB0_9CNID|nr:hypothetical protein OS493_039023 [Desmophyllum pertusum]